MLLATIFEEHCDSCLLYTSTDLTAGGESYEKNYERAPLFGNTRDSLIYVNDYPGDHDKMDPYISQMCIRDR